MIDWNFALATATTLSRPGPDLSAGQVSEVVADLRRAAVAAVDPVREVTGLEASRDAPVLVVDRPRWIEANLASFEHLMTPLNAKLAAAGKTPNGFQKAVGTKIAGAEIGALVSFLSGKVLGQFDPFSGDGRLLLVAPNIAHVEDELSVVPSDFRLWVCLHEETHRAQFTGVPWMRAHLELQVTRLLDATELDNGAVAAVLGDSLGEIVKIAKGESQASISDLFQNDEQRAVVDELTGMMSLLEGHADVVMDAVGPRVVPTVAEIRRKFERRRSSAGGLSKVLRRLLGLEAKMRQYRDGAAFVRAVTAKVGDEGFNAVWAEPGHLPTKAEIADPAAWVTRVHG